MRRLRRFGIDASALAKVRRFARAGSRAVLFTTVACVLGLIAAQYARIVVKNVTVARELAQSRAEIQALQRREVAERRTIVRLSDPQGAVPEIHDKLHIVGKREEIIYVRGVPHEAPEPATGIRSRERRSRDRDKHPPSRRDRSARRRKSRRRGRTRARVAPGDIRG